MLSKLKKTDYHEVLNFQVKLSTHSTKTPRGHWELAVTRCSAAVWVTDTFPTCLSQLWDIPVTGSDHGQGYWGLSSMSLSMARADRFWGLSCSNTLTNSYRLRTCTSGMSKFTPQIKNSFPAQISKCDLVAQPGSSHERRWQNGHLSLCWIPGAGEAVWCGWPRQEDGSTEEASLCSQIRTDSNLPTETHHTLHPSTKEGNSITRATLAYSMTYLRTIR